MAALRHAAILMMVICGFTGPAIAGGGGGGGGEGGGGWGGGGHGGGGGDGGGWGGGGHGGGGGEGGGGGWGGSGGCPTGYDKCQQNSKSCETCTKNDVNHCGRCGNKCPSYSCSTPTCTWGTCGSICSPGFKDCDSNQQNGCETNVDNDAMNCGSCGTKCPTYPYSTTSCSNGKCTPMCNPGMKDCNGNWNDGCETDTGKDTNNCGGCGIKCPTYPHSTTSCNNGKCTPMCNAGWMNCNGDWTDGCETNVGTDANNCGGCNSKCPMYPYSTTSCSNGKCTPMCNSGMKDCNGNWNDGCETDTGKDTNNCGGCGIKCPTYPHSTTSCNNGKCTPVCNAGWMNCNGDWSDGCETNVGTDANNCGGCNSKCPMYPYSSTSCSNGKCTPMCNSGMKDCNGNWNDGCETDTGKDTNNCGGCGIKCPTYPHSTTSCNNGKCTPVCNAGWMNCNGDWTDGCETNVGTDASNCGGCKSKCPTYPYSTTTCSNGKCTPVCNSGMKDCNGNWLDGCETDTSKDTNNCGSCGMVCPTYPHSTTTCSNGKCTPVCNAGWKNCNGDWKDGCETNVGTDCNNCGNCGSTCPIYPHSTRSCSNGKCTPMCNSGWKDCNGNWNDGCEVNVNSDVNNCGGCGKSCPCADVNGLPSCSNGSCGVQCKTGYKYDTYQRQCIKA